MLRHRLSLVSIAIIVSLLAGSQAVAADSPGRQRTVVFVADSSAIVGTAGGMGLTRSVVGLVSALQPNDSFAFIAADRPDEAKGPALPGSPRFDVVSEHLYTGASQMSQPDIVNSLTRAYNLLNSAGAPDGSTIYLIAGARPQADLGVEADRLGPTLDLLRANRWPVIGLALPTAAPQVTQFLDHVTSRSGGEVVELSASNGLKRLADMILRDESGGSLASLSDRKLSLNEVLTSPLSIAPGTSDIRLLFFKEDPYGSVRLTNPAGLEISPEDRAESFVTQTSHVVIWQLVDPVPGQWTVVVRGMEGSVSSWHLASNRYAAALVSYGAVPLNEASTLVAYITDNGSLAFLDDVRVVARITTPDGAVVAHELNDQGLTGDSLAGDGYYSGMIPPVTSEGFYNVDLQIVWPEFGHSVSSQTGFEALEFPTIELTPIKTDEIAPGQRAKVATAVVHVNGQPYSIATDRMSALISSNVDTGGVLEVKPQRLLSEGRAWMYDVFFTPEAEGLHTINLQLELEYSDRPYTYASDYMVVSSFLPTTRGADPVQPRPETPAKPTVEAEPASGFPWALVAGVLIAVGALSAAGAFYWSTLSRPYGYLYNDRDEPVVDFGSLERSTVMHLFSKNMVRGHELDMPGLESLTFRFFPDRIDVSGRRDAPSVRVNNQPLIGRATVQERAWIGTAGRLYSLLLAAEPTLEPQFGGDDD